MKENRAKTKSKNIKINEWVERLVLAEQDGDSGIVPLPPCKYAACITNVGRSTCIGYYSHCKIGFKCNGKELFLVRCGIDP